MTATVIRSLLSAGLLFGAAFSLKAGTVDVPRNFTVVSTDATTGSVALTKTGAGTLSLIGSEGNTFSGDIVVDTDAGTLKIGGILGAAGPAAQGVAFPGMTSANSLTVKRNGTFYIEDNAMTTVAGYLGNRLGTDGNRPNVTLAGGALYFNGANVAAVTTQSVGVLTLDPGPSAITIVRAAGTPQLVFSSLAAAKGSYVTYVGALLGTAAANVPQILFTTPPSNIVGGGGAPGTKTMSIVTGARLGNDLVYYGANGLRAVVTGEYNDVTGNDINPAGATENVRIIGATPVALPALTAPRTVNSLILLTQAAATWAMADTLTLTSGQLLSTPNAARTISSGTLTAGSGSAADLAVTILGTGAIGFGGTIANNGAGAVTLVKNGTGTLTLNSLTDNTYSGGTYVNEGALTLVGVATNRRFLGTGPVVVDNAVLTLSGVGATANGTGDDYTAVNGAQIAIPSLVFTADDTFNIGPLSVLNGSVAAGVGLNSLDRGSDGTSPYTNIVLAENAIIAQPALTAPLNLSAGTVKNLGTAAELYYGLNAAQAALAGSVSVGSGTPFKGISTMRTAQGWNLGTINVGSGTSDIYLQGLAVPGTAPYLLTVGNLLVAGGPVITVADAGTLNVNIQGAVTIDDDAALFGDTTAGKLVKFVVAPGATLTINAPAGMGSGTGVASIEVQAGGTLAIANPAALNGAVTVKAGGRFLASQALGLTGAGALTFETGAILDITAVTGFSGPQAAAATVNPGTVVRLSIANIGTLAEPLNSYLGGKSVVFEPFGGVFWPLNPASLGSPIMTLDKDAATGEGGLLVNDSLSRLIVTVPNGVIAIGTNGGTIAATTNTILTMPQPIALGTNMLTIGTTNRVDGMQMPKHGTVLLNAGVGYSTALPGSRIEVVPGATLNQSVNSLPDAADVTVGGTLLLGGADTIGSLAGGGRVALGANALTVGRSGKSTTFSGELSGSGAILKTGAGRLDITSYVTNNSLVTVNGGTLALSGAGQTTNTGTTAYTLIGDGTLLLDNTNVNMGNRLAGTAPGITFQGGTFRFMGKNGEASSETLGVPTFTSGRPTIDLVNGSGAGSSVQLTFGAPVLAAGFVNFTASNGTLGLAGDNPRVLFSSGIGTGFVGFATVGSAPAYYEAATGIRAFNLAEGTEFDGTAAQATNLNTVYTAANNHMALTAARAVNSIWIDSPGTGYSIDLGSSGANTLKLNSGRITLTGPDSFEIKRSGTSTGSLANNSLNGKMFFGIDNAGATLTLSAPIAASTGTIEKDGAGTLVLNAANLFTTGGLTINAGTVQYGPAGDLAPTMPLTVMGGGALDFNGITDTIAAVTIFEGGITNSGSGGALTVGALALGSGSAGSSAYIDSGSGVLKLGSTIAYNIVNDPDKAILAGNLDLNGALRVFTVGNSVAPGAAVDLEISAVVTGGVGFGISKAGVGVMKLSGANTHDGILTNTAGTVILANSQALGLPSVARIATIASGATLALDGAGISDPNDRLTLSLNGAGDTLLGPVSGALLNLAGTNVVPSKVTLAAAAQVASLGGKLTLGGNITGAFGLTVTGEGDTTLDGVLGTGVGTLTKNGGGSLVLSASNTYSGITTINAGTLVAAHTNALGTSTVTLSGGALRLAADDRVSPKNFNAMTMPSTIILDRSTPGEFPATTMGSLLMGNMALSVVKGANVTAGTPSLTFGNTLGTTTIGGTFNIADGIDVTLGALQGTLCALIKNGAGRLILNTVSVRTTGATTLNAGTLVLGGVVGGANDALGTTGYILMNGGTLVLAADASAKAHPLFVDANAQIVVDRATSGAGVANTLGTLSRMGPYTLSVSAGTNVTSGTAGLAFGTATLNGDPIFSVATNGSGADTLLTLAGIADAGVPRTITKNGPGSLTVSAASTMTDGTRVRVAGGRLNANIAAALGTLSVVDVADGAVLRFGAAHTLGSLSNTNSVLNNGNVLIDGAYVLTIGAANNLNSDFSGTIRGVGGLTKAGLGTLTLSGSNDYSGVNTLSQGVLVSKDPFALSTNSVTMAAATLDLASDSSIYPRTVTLSATPATIAVNRATPGNGIGHTLGAMVTGANRLNVVVGNNVTNAAGSLSFDAVTFATGAILDIADGLEVTLGPLGGTTAALFTKLGQGRLILGSAASTRTTSATTLNGGTLVLGGVVGPTYDALGTTGALAINTGTVVFATDTSLKAHAVTVGGDVGLVLDRATGGETGIVNTLGALSIGNFKLAVTGGGNGISGTNAVVFSTTTLTGNPVFEVTTNGLGAETLVTLGALADGSLGRTITKTGSGTLALGTAASSLIGGTTLRVEAGRVNANIAAALGSLAVVDVADEAIFGVGAAQTIGALSNTNSPLNTASVELRGAYALTVGATNNLNSLFSGTIVGPGALTKAGGGTLVLTGDNTYSGLTSINGGWLLASNTAGSATGTNVVHVNAAGTLSGEGFISGTVSNRNGGTLQPGLAGVAGGTLTVGGLSLFTGSTNVFEFASGTNDQIVVTGGVWVVGGDVLLVEAGTTNAWTTEGVYTLAQFDGAISGNPALLTVRNPAAGKVYFFDVSYGSPNRLTVSVAKDIFWSGASEADGNWTTAANWEGGVPTSPETLVFAGTGGNWLTGNNNDFTSGTLFGGLLFNSGSYAFTLAGNPISLGGSLVNNSTNIQTLALPVNLDSGIRIFNVASGFVTMAASVGETGGTGSLVKNGAGALTLAAGNTFGGGVTMNAGTLNLAHSGALGSGPLTLAGGSLDAVGTDVAVSGGNSYEWNNSFIFKGTRNLNLGAGPVTLNNNISLTTQGTGDLYVAGAIAGPYRLTKVGAAQYLNTLTLAGASTFSGGFTLSSGSVRVGLLADGGQPSSIGASSSDAGNFVLGGGFFVYTGATVTIDRNIRLQSDTRFEIVDPNTTLTIAGNITNAASWSLVTSMSGTLELLGDDNQLGGFLQVSGGYASYEGRMSAGGGRLMVNGKVRSGTLQATYGNIISGTGTVSVAGKANMAGSHIRPGLDGTAGGILTFNANPLVFTNVNDSIVLECNSLTNDILVSTNGPFVMAMNLNVSLVEEGTLTPWKVNGDYRLIQTSGSVEGLPYMVFGNPAADTAYTFFLQDNWIMLRIAGPVGPTWDGGGSDDNWSSLANWNPESPLVLYDAVRFAGSSRLTPFNDYVNRTNGAIVFTDTPSPAGSFTLAGNSVFLEGNVVNYSAVPQTVGLPLVLSLGNRTFNATSQAITVTSVIGDAGAGYGLVKAGAYPVSLSGDNDYAGLTLVAHGALNAQHANALGTAAGGTVVASNATLQLQGGIDVADEPLLLYGLGVASNGALRNTQDANTFGGPITLGGPASINSDGGTLTLDSAAGIAGAFGLTLGGSSTTVVATVINTGANSLTKNGAGTVILAVPNTYSGLTTILDGRLAYGCDNAIAGGAVTINGNNAVLDIGAYNDTVGLITLTAGAIAGSGTLDISAGLNLNNGAACPDVYCSAVLAGSGNILKSGSGYRATLLATNSTYTGKTEPSGGGILSVSYLANGGLPSSIGAASSDEWNLVLHGQLEYTGPSVTIDRSMVIAPSCNILGFRGHTTQTDQDEGSIVVTQPETTLTLIGVLHSNTNAVAPEVPVSFFFKLGPGTLELANTNTYVGRTAVMEGTLKVSGSIAATNFFWTTPLYNLTVSSNATVSGGGSIGPAVQVYAYGSIAPGQDVPAGAALTVGGLILQANSRAKFEFSNDPTNDTVVLTGSDNLTINGGSVYLYEEGTTNAWTADGTYNLIQYAGAIAGGGPGLLSVGNPAPDKGYTFAVKDGWVTVTIGASSMWDGGGADDNWLTAENWTLDAAPSADDLLVFSGAVRPDPVNDYAAGTRFGGITFDGAAEPFELTGNAVKLAGNVINASSNLQAVGLAVELDSNDRIFSALNGALLVSGAISDGGNGLAFVKSGSGVLTLAGANTYGGATVVSQGKLSLGASEAIPDGAGKGALDLAAGAMFDLNGFNETVNSLKGLGVVSNSTGASTLTLGGGDVSSTSTVHLADGDGALALTKAGSGLVELPEANDYSGKTVVSNGTLRVSNASGSATGSGDVDVLAGAVLDGTGMLQGGLLTLAGAGVVEPGAGGTGTLTVDGLAWSDNAVYVCEVTDLANTAGQGYDSLVAAGAAAPVLAGDKLVIRLDSLGQTLTVPASESVSIRVLTAPAAIALDAGDYTLDTNDFLAEGDWALTNIGDSIYAYCRLASQTNVWIGSGAWSNPTNWSSGNVPQVGDAVIFDGTSSGDCLAAFNSVNGELASLTLDTGYLGTVTFAKRAASGTMTLRVAGVLAVNSGSLVFEGDPDVIGAGTASNPYGQGYTIAAGSIVVAEGASLNADNMGFGPLTGPGKAVIRTTQYGVISGAYGASYGGYAGQLGVYTNPNPRYGTAAGPTALGSGGSLPGGGALRLKAGAVTINGQLSASAVGAIADAPCASGGSIWIDGGVLNGTGAIVANGKSTTDGTVGAGGGGGRIDLSGTTNNFAGAIEVLGGYGNFSTAANINTRTMRRGLTGSILIPQSEGTGLTLDTFTPYTNIAFGNSLTFGAMTINSGVTVKVQAYNDETVVTCGTMTIRSNGTFISLGDYFAANEANGGTPNYPYGQGMTVVASNIVIDAGGSLNADNEGFMSAKYSYVSSLPGAYGTGPGGAPTYNVTAASYGGQPGGNTGTPAYSDITKRALMYGTAVGPTALGSAGNQHGYSGGGAVKLVVSGTITVNGALSADSTNAPNTAGSSGGSIWIVSGTLEGVGRITANGSGGSSGGAAGGGGRIDISGVTNNFAGTLQARGGYGLSAFARGQAGSLVLPATTLESFSPHGTNFIFGNSVSFGDCVVSNGVLLTLECNEGQNTFTFDSLTIENGGTVRCMGNLLSINEAAGGTSNSILGQGVTLIASNLTIEAGGSLNADGRGFDSVALPAAHPLNNGAYGGMAGGFGGTCFGSLSNVTALGSGGAVTGGGAIRLIVTDTLTVDGSLSCNGSGTAAGYGGSGGSLWIDCATLQGAGVIAANGSSVGTINRNGGGGRVHLLWSGLGAINPLEHGTVSAFGGGAHPFYKGAAGTVLLQNRESTESLGSLVVVNDTAATNSVTLLPDGDLELNRIYMADSYVYFYSNRTLAVTTVFSNQNVFAAGESSTVSLVGTNEATVYGSGAFSGLRIDDTNKVVRFEAGKTTLVQRALSLNNASLQSTTYGAAWNLVLGAGASQDVRLVWVSDSHAGGGSTIRVQSRRSRDEGNNVNWVFPATGSLIIVR